MDGFIVKHETKLKEEDVESLLVSALEGGSRDWALIEANANRKKDKANGCKYLSDYVLKGSGLIISNGTEEAEDSKDYVKTLVDRDRVQIALQLMAELEPSHFANIMSDNADATTGDILLQICVLEKVIYG